MKIKSIIKLICTVMLLFLCTANELYAQKQVDSERKQKHSIFQLGANHKFEVLPSFAKMKTAADNGIVQSVSQYYDEGKWHDSYRTNYEYSPDRLFITMNFEFYDPETKIWSDAGSSTLKMKANGLPESSSMDFLGMVSEQHYYYETTDPVKIDSVVITETLLNGEMSTEKYTVNYITQDSIRIILTTTDSLGTHTNSNNYFVNRDGNFIEVYDEGEYLDRYTYFDISFEDMLKNISNEFFFVETYNDELYSGETEFTPYSRITLNKNGETVVGRLEEYYYDTEHSWQAEYRETFTYDAGKIIKNMQEYSSDGMTWNADYRTLYSYSGAVSNEREIESSTGFVLSQNYPNPFNPTTQIEYTISEPGYVLLEVFNVIGNKVATLVQTKQHAGTHTATFNARSLSSGIYYYKLTSGNKAEVRSMTLIK